jgi:transposase
MEQRRTRAARMFERGVSDADVARQLGVSRQSVSRWHADWKRGGTEALKAAGRAGRLPRLSEAQLAEVERALRRGPRANGFTTDLWTLDRVAAVIEAETGVGYHPGHVWKLFARQVGVEPSTAGQTGGRTRRRSDRPLGRPRLATDKKGARRRRAWIVFQDESGFSLLPPVRATWAPRGHTPVLRHRFNWKRLSMSAAVAYAPTVARPGSCSPPAPAPTTTSR